MSKLECNPYSVPTPHFDEVFKGVGQLSSAEWALNLSSAPCTLLSLQGWEEVAFLKTL